MSEQGVKLPHDVHGLLPYVGYGWLYFAAAGFLLVALIACLIWWLKRWSGKDLQEQSEPELPLEDQLMNALLRLNVDQPFDHPRQKEYYYQLTMILKRWLEDQFGFPATDLTTKEIKLRFPERHQKGREETIRSVNFFLDQADRVKFAEQTVAIDQATKDRDQVKTWLRELRAFRPVNQDVRGIS